MLRTVAFGALAFFVFNIPFENALKIPGMGSFSKLFGMLTFGLGVLALARSRSRLSFRPPPLFLLLAGLFVGWGILSYYWSIVPSYSMSRAVSYLQLLAMAWLIWEYGKDSQHRLVLTQSFVFGCYVAIAIALTGFFTSSGANFRDVGENFNANDFAAILALGIPMAWRLSLLRRRIILMWLNLLYLPFAIFAIVLAASRGGMIAAIVALTIIPLTFSRLGLLRKIGLTALLAVGVWVIFVYAPQAFPSLQANLARIGETSSELREGTLTNRTDIWAAGLEVFSENSYAGVGLGAYAAAVEPIYGKRAVAHNVFLSVLVSLGVVGLMLFLLMLVILIAPSLYLPQKQKAFCLTIFLSLFVSFMSLSIEDRKPTWFVFALLACESAVMVSYRRPQTLLEYPLGKTVSGAM